jgi:hypothetical protein
MAANTKVTVKPNINDVVVDVIIHYLSYILRLFPFNLASLNRLRLFALTLINSMRLNTAVSEGREYYLKKGTRLNQIVRYSPTPVNPHSPAFSFGTELLARSHPCGSSLGLS